MKNKPKRHKATNTFKFQKFSERIANIKIDVIHKVKHPYEEDDEDSNLHYSLCLNKWNNENFSPDFVELSKKLPKDIYSLPQLLAQKNEIVNLLVNHLRTCNMDALQPALEIIVAVAKDLSKEFYQFFYPSILRESIRLLDTREPDQIEWIFTCLAYLFKYLWVPIVRNISSILPELLPLLSSSQPEYIINFAAESFAYVARKVRDKSQFLKLSLRNIKNSDDELSGIARLYFEVITNVGNQFHSGAEEFLVIILMELDNRKWTDFLFRICESLVHYLIAFISLKTNVSPLWKSITKVANEFVDKWMTECNLHNAENLTMLLKLVQRFITCRELILRNPEELLNFLLTLTTNNYIKDFINLHNIVIDIISHLLTDQKFSSKLKNCENIFTKVMNSIYDEKLAMQFVEKTVLLPKYEMLAVHELLKCINRNGLSEHVIRFLAKVIWIKTKFRTDETNDGKMKFYSTNLKSMPESSVEHLMEGIDTTNIPASAEQSLFPILVLSYIEKYQSAFVNRADEYITQLCKVVDDVTEVEQSAKLLYFILIAFQFRGRFKLHTTFSYETLIRLSIKFVNSSNHLCALLILEALSKYDVFKCLNSRNEKMKLINNLCSPFHKVRLFTLQVLVKMNIHPVFDQMANIEMISSSVETYREKLYQLQKLEYNENFMHYVQDEFIEEAVLKFLFGNLYINFKYLWEPTQKLILSHLENCKNAYSVYEYQLNEAVVNDINSIKLMEEMIINFESEFLQQHFYDLNGVDDRPDFYNFRCLLLEVLTNCRNIHFSNKYFIPEVFMKFYDSEYTSSVFEFRFLCNIKKFDKNSEDLMESQSELKSPNSDGEIVKHDKNLNRLFIIFLKLIGNSSQHIPVQMRSKIFDIHFELLANGNSTIQELAVNYICKVKKLMSLKERLLLLIKEHTFKNELLNIRIDFHSDVIPEKDKYIFMRIVLKMLQGKIRKKSSVHLREAMFEFLAGCNDADIISFFDLFFKQFSSLVKDSSISPLTYDDEEIDLEHVVSPSCLLSYVHTAGDLLKRCGRLLKHPCLHYLLRIILKVAASLVALLKKKSEIHSGYYGLLSKIRVSSFETITLFVENFDYEWEKEEILAVFKFFVEPWINKVSEECLQSPNPVMKLFMVFAANTKYFPLLTRKCGNISALDALMDLLNSNKVYFNVKNVVVNIIEQLLTLEEDSNEKVTFDLMFMDNTTEKSLQKRKHYGKVLLMPYISTILEYLQTSLVKKYIKIDGVYMIILKRISEFTLNEEDSVALLKVLVPILKNKATAEEHIVLPLLDTIFNLFKIFENTDLFEEYLLEIASLFNVVTVKEVRKALGNIVGYISQRTGTKFVIAEYVKGLNLCDHKWLDQPDYTARLKTFKQINEACEKGELNLYTGLFIIQNCFHMMRTEKDMALRDHSGLCLKRICPILIKNCKSAKETNLLLNVILLPLIKDGIQSKNENNLSESLMLLGHMVRECSDCHPVFNNLNVLTDKLNLENDFFENIQHLQNYRKVKALKRFIELMSQVVKSPTPYSLTFLLPLVTQPLLNQNTAKEHGLISCAIEALKVICCLSPWRLYERILQQYLTEMRKDSSLRKQGIRIISAILDAFHFDISQAQDTDVKNATSDKKKKSKNLENMPELMEVDDVEDDEIKVNTEKQLEPAVKRITVLCRSDAIRVYRTIKSFLVPNINRTFMMYDEKNQYHKLSKKNTNDEEELAVLSLPIALAAVKLLKRLPGPLLDEYISIIFLKLSTYLKSHLPSIRLVARETMQNILMEIGPSYFPKLLSEMMSILTKGSSMHVLVFTCHAILEKTQTLFTAEQMDACVDSILEICIIDVFGKLAEEKQVAKIVNKTEEAKGNKSYNMLNIVAEYVSESRLVDLILPLKEIAANSLSSETVEKVSKCLHYISLGLTRNQFISAESLLIFSYGVSNDCIPALVAERENNKVRIESVGPVQKPDSFLIPEEPRNLTAEKRKICCRTNAHLITEFGLKLLELMLKREIIKSPYYRPHLDPFVPLMNDCLQSQYMKLTEITLKCLIWLLKRDLPSMNENVSHICETVFLILGKYSSAGVSGEHAKLVVSAIEVAVVLIRDLKYEINNSQLRILLFVVEDLQKNISHYENAFSLLRAIIGRQFNIPEVHELMKKIAQLSICSYNEKIRLMARKVLYKYLLKYPLGKKLRQHVMFYTSQLKYEESSGRKSALEMLTVLTNVFPLDVLRELGSLLFVQLAFRLIMDDSVECKKMAADCISKIITRIQGTKQETELFDIVLIWIKEKKILNRSLAVQLLGLFALVLKEKFVPKLDNILLLVENQLHYDFSEGPGKYVKAASLYDSEEANMEKDQLLFQVLQLYKTLAQTCPVMLTDSTYTEKVQKIAENCQFLLRHSHEWVRFGATQVLGVIFKSLDVEEISMILNKKKKYCEFGFLRDKQTKQQIRSLCLDFCDQLAPGYDVMEQLLKQTMKNLLFLAQVLQNVLVRDNKKVLSLQWLVSRLVKQVKKEVAVAPQKYTVRTVVFNWFAALAIKCDQNKLIPVLPIVLLPIMRELANTEAQGMAIRRMAKEVLQHYRQKIDADEYNKTVNRVQRFLDIKRAKRKVQNTQMAILDPERAAKNKLRKQQKKKEQQKRKKEKLRKRKVKKKIVIIS